MIKGIVEKIGVRGVSGWVQMPRETYRPEAPPTIQVFVAGMLFAEGPTSVPRLDLTVSHFVGLGFSLSPLVTAYNPQSVDDVKAFVNLDGTTVPLELQKSLRLSLELGSLTDSQINAVKLHFTPEQSRKVALGLVPWLVPHGGESERGKLCVVTYANDATAWFPYFYKHYVELVGPHGIYVVTPAPQLFEQYSLGGLITASNLQFDDRARAFLMSHLVTGLHAYYTWSIVCDVDEFIVPHPESKLTFLEILDSSKQGIMISRGLDILQAEGEPDFDLTQPILPQRRYAVPNTAICKPHLSSVPVIYSGGFHYCQEKVNFSGPREGFLTLHLKWACGKMRNAVAEAVRKTVYSNKETADYALRSVSSTAPSNGSICLFNADPNP
jgi:hypothetical protein